MIRSHRFKKKKKREMNRKWIWKTSIRVINFLNTTFTMTTWSNSSVCHKSSPIMKTISVTLRFPLFMFHETIKWNVDCTSEALNLYDLLMSLPMDQNEAEEKIFSIKVWMCLVYMCPEIISPCFTALSEQSKMAGWMVQGSPRVDTESMTGCFVLLSRKLT